MRFWSYLGRKIIKFLCFQGFEAIVDFSLEFPLASRGGIIIRPGHVVTLFTSLRVKLNLISSFHIKA